jgi:hypothetical protein
MTAMTSIKAHFDGAAVVLDEPPPLALAIGQAVRVIVDPSLDTDAAATDDLAAASQSSTGFWDNPFDEEDWNDK